jgi:multidrug resistance efflux pump
MTRKVVPWILGLVALGVTVFVANNLLKAQNTPTESSTSERPGKVTGNAPANGITVKAIVDVPDGIYRVDAPAIASALTVSEVLVKEGQEVKLDDPLIQFDTAPFKEKVEQAKAAVKQAEALESVAKLGIEDKKQKIKLQEIAVAAARIEADSAVHSYKQYLTDLNERLDLYKDLNTRQPYSAEEKERMRGKDPMLETLRVGGLLKPEKLKKEQLDLDRLKEFPAAEELAQASAGVERANAVLREADAMLKACTLKSKVAGVVEQVFANPGMTFSAALRTPALLIVPSGKRVVRAEVEAEFAHKISDRVGQTVTIYDDHNFNITYTGTVKRVGTAFLPKRGASDALQVGPANRVLEVVVEVADPTPKGKPPLLPGLPVRVGFTK